MPQQHRRRSRRSRRDLRFRSGVVDFSYGSLPMLPNFSATAFAGISIGNAVGTGLELSSDLAASPNSGTLGLLYQEFTGSIPSVSDRTITLAPNGTGGFVAVVSCQSGSHTTLGTGCYGETVVQYFADAAVASAALQGNAMLLSPTGAGYTMNWVPGGAAAFYLAPTLAASSLPITNDGSTVVTPSSPMPIPGGTTATLTVEHNGNILIGSLPNHDFDWTPLTSKVGAAMHAGFYSWHDYNDTEAGSGAIKTEHRVVGSDTLFVVTWDGVENYSAALAVNPSTIQFQFNLTTGLVTYVWRNVDADPSSFDGSAHLIGYTGPGAGSDPGSFSFPTSLTATAIDTYSALSLSATPSPVIGVGGSSNAITSTIGSMTDYAAPAGLRLGILIFSVVPAPGIDLAVIGAPGCQAYIGSLDVQFSFAAIGSAQQSLAITFPPPLASGLSFFSQAVALIPPGSYPGGLNAFGLLTSNGLQTTF